MKLLLTAFLSAFVLVIVFGFTTENILPQRTLPDEPTLKVDIPEVGTVLGNFETTLWTNQTFMQFRGIPYAESPKGRQRFKPPTPRKPWRQAYDATHWGRRCPVITSISQLSEEKLKEDLEDCLNLCVYTKNLTAKQPVMVYLYGGGFYNGSASDHPPRYLLEKDVVLVVPHYRVGALGWLSTRTVDIPGNAPIMDLLLALQWVQKNIGVFGGDSQNITIFAQSGGTALAGSLLLSPLTPRGLIKRAIVQSGSIMAKWAINENAESQVYRICRALDCGPCITPLQLHKCLTDVNVSRLLEATKDEFFSPIAMDFHKVLPQRPAELFKDYNSSIPVMTGFTSHDGSFALATYYDEIKKALGDFNHMTVRQIASGIMAVTNDSTGLTNSLLTRLLFTAKLLDNNDHKEAIPSYFDLCNILYIKAAVISFATQLKQRSLADVYLYSFEYAGEHTRFGYEFGNEHYPFNGGVHHSDDNIYLFSTHNLNEQDTEVAKRMVELWTSFAATGVPSAPKAPNILPMQTESGPYFHINDQIVMDYDVLKEYTATIDDPNNKELARDGIEF